MRLDQLDLQAFRNLDGIRLEPSPTFNIFTGDNGQGKTNLLEAIYFLGRLRSFRAARLEQLIAHGQPSARLAARVAWPGLTSQLEIELQPGGKRVRVDGKGIGRIGDHCSHYRLVLFTPEDVDLPRGEPKVRRAFLDRALFNREPSFLAEAQALEAVLQRRNALLRPRGAAGGSAPVTAELLEPYDRQLAEAGARVACHRRDFVSGFSEPLARIVGELFGGQVRAGLRYVSTVPTVADGASPEEAAQAFLVALRRNRPRDLAQRTTTLGPQRDDLQMLLDERPLKEHASQGQHRVFVLALKIAEIEALHSLGGARPALLLDDISSELDARRNEFLFRYLASVQSQVFITTTAAELVRIPDSSRLDLQVRGGRLWNAS